MIDVYMLNGIAVGLFGMLLSAAFCNILWSRKKRWLMAGGMAGILLLQGAVYFLVDRSTVQVLYPLITHVPLIILLCALGRKWFWNIISVFTAYLCCQLRRWLALLIVAIVSGNAVTQEIIEIAITVPLLLVLIRFIAPSVRYIGKLSVSIQCQFAFIPVLGYLFDYVTQIYTNLFVKGTPLVTEFMAFVCSVAYLVFVLHTSKENQIKSQMEQAQENLNLQVLQAVREIELLRDSWQQARTYRHDLRHHMQYLSACIENGQSERAQTYIRDICAEIEASKVICYCDNETTNLIFSAFAGRAKEQNIPINIRAEIPKIIAVSESDLCVLLSNALENALHACQGLKAKGITGLIDVLVYEKGGKLFIQIENSCDEDVMLEQGIPVTDKQGHGLGVRSICALVERYNGIYTFSVKNKKFTLRVSV
ncbi:MAG: GHKL domain-containing protein [Lachnospiraceae bacterium]|nr:GHKL domain-containing protein [Lachnospiraceae bacterium]